MTVIIISDTTVHLDADVRFDTHHQRDTTFLSEWRKVNAGLHTGKDTISSTVHRGNDSHKTRRIYRWLTCAISFLQNRFPGGEESGGGWLEGYGCVGYSFMAYLVECSSHAESTQVLETNVSLRAVTHMAIRDT